MYVAADASPAVKSDGPSGSDRPAACLLAGETLAVDLCSKARSAPNLARRSNLNR